MMTNGRAMTAAAALVAVAVVALVYTPARAQREAAAGAARYSVLDTEGHNLIVTDNQTNTLYFYTVDKGAEIGSDLKLRGSLDLTQVGKPVIRPTKAKREE